MFQFNLQPAIVGNRPRGHNCRPFWGQIGLDGLAGFCNTPPPRWALWAECDIGISRNNVRE
jgi:hypothetical protein